MSEELTARFDTIRRSYQNFSTYIFKRFESTKRKERWVYPYVLHPLCFDFTPIEECTWRAIRSYGKAPFYPQYPVGKYFLDFGNPIVKVAIECDGQAWHTDKQKDLNRDRDLGELGWTVYRISGKECVRVIRKNDNPDEMEIDLQREKARVSETIEGLIECMGVRYFNQNFFGNYELSLDMMCKSLNAHVSVKTDEYDRELSCMIQAYHTEIEKFEN